MPDSDPIQSSFEQKLAHSISQSYFFDFRQQIGFPGDPHGILADPSDSCWSCAERLMAALSVEPDPPAFAGAAEHPHFDAAMDSLRQDMAPLALALRAPERPASQMLWKDGMARAVARASRLGFDPKQARLMAEEAGFHATLLSMSGPATPPALGESENGDELSDSLALDGRPHPSFEASLGLRARWILGSFGLSHFISTASAHGFFPTRPSCAANAYQPKYPIPETHEHPLSLRFKRMALAFADLSPSIDELRTLPERDLAIIELLCAFHQFAHFASPHWAAVPKIGGAPWSARSSLMTVAELHVVAQQALLESALDGSTPSACDAGAPAARPRL